MVKRGLGRGLSALIPGPPVPPAETTTSASTVETAETGISELAHHLDLSAIRPNPFQPRTSMNESDLQELVQSIRVQGLLQPVIVRPFGNGYQLVAGERRWRAAQQAGLTTIPAVIRDCSDREMLEIAIVENLQRSNINPLDAARAYQRLGREFALTQQEVAERVGKSRSAVANTMRLLELPPDLQSLLQEGKLTEGHARALLMSENAATMRALAGRIVREGLNVRQAERLAGAAPRARRGSAAAPRTDAILDDLLERLQRRLGTRVRLRRTARGGGVLEVECADAEQLLRVADLLLGLEEGGGT